MCIWPDSDHILLSIVDRFELFDWFSGRPHKLDGEVAGCEPSQVVYLVEEFLTVLIVLVSDRDVAAGRSSKELSRREIIHGCLSQTSYSELTKKIPERLADHPQFDTMLLELATFRPPTSVLDSGVYELKDEYLDEVDPHFIHYSKNQREEIEEVLLLRLKKRYHAKGLPPSHIGADINPPIIIPNPIEIKQGVFRGLAGILHTKLSCQVLFYALCNCTKNHMVSSSTILDSALHLVLLALIDGARGEMATNLNYGAERGCGGLWQYSIELKFDVPGESGAPISLLELLLVLRLRNDVKQWRTKIELIIKLFRKGSVEISRWIDGYLNKLRESGMDLESIEMAHDEENEAERKRKAAKERQAQIMADFAKAQQTFISNFGDQLEDISDEENYERGHQEGKDDMNISSDPTNKSIPATVYKPTLEVPGGACIVCQESCDGSKPYGVLALVQSTYILRQAPLNSSHHVAEIIGQPLSLDEPLPFDKLMNYSKDDMSSENPKAQTEDDTKEKSNYNVYNEVADTVDLLHLYEKTPISLGAPSGLEGFPPSYRQRGSVASSCGHTMHQTCFDQYCKEAKIKQSRQLLRNYAETLDRGEFLCPLCNSLGNFLLPILTETNKSAGLVEMASEDFGNQTMVDFDKWLTGEWSGLFSKLNSSVNPEKNLPGLADMSSNIPPVTAATNTTSATSASASASASAIASTMTATATTAAGAGAGATTVGTNTSNPQFGPEAQLQNEGINIRPDERSFMGRILSSVTEGQNALNQFATIAPSLGRPSLSSFRDQLPDSISSRLPTDLLSRSPLRFFEGWNALRQRVMGATESGRVEVNDEWRILFPITLYVYSTFGEWRNYVNRIQRQLSYKQMATTHEHSNRSGYLVVENAPSSSKLNRGHKYIPTSVGTNGKNSYYSPNPPSVSFNQAGTSRSAAGYTYNPNSNRNNNPAIEINNRLQVETNDAPLEDSASFESRNYDNFRQIQNIETADPNAFIWPRLRAYGNAVSHATAGSPPWPGHSGVTLQNFSNRGAAFGANTNTNNHHSNVNAGANGNTSGAYSLGIPHILGFGNDTNNQVHFETFAAKEELQAAITTYNEIYKQIQKVAEVVSVDNLIGLPHPDLFKHLLRKNPNRTQPQFASTSQSYNNSNSGSSAAKSIENEGIGNYHQQRGTGQSHLRQTVATTATTATPGTPGATTTTGNVDLNRYAISSRTSGRDAPLSNDPRSHSHPHPHPNPHPHPHPNAHPHSTPNAHARTGPTSMLNSVMNMQTSLSETAGQYAESLANFGAGIPFIGAIPSAMRTIGEMGANALTLPDLPEPDHHPSHTSTSRVYGGSALSSDIRLPPHFIRPNQPDTDYEMADANKSSDKPAAQHGNVVDDEDDEMGYDDHRLDGSAKAGGLHDEYKDHADVVGAKPQPVLFEQLLSSILAETIMCVEVGARGRRTPKHLDQDDPRRLYPAQLWTDSVSFTQISFIYALIRVVQSHYRFLLSDCCSISEIASANLHRSSVLAKSEPVITDSLTAESVLASKHLLLDSIRDLLEPLRPPSALDNPTLPPLELNVALDQLRLPVKPFLMCDPFKLFVEQSACVNELVDLDQWRLLRLFFIVELVRVSIGVGDSTVGSYAGSPTPISSTLCPLYTRFNPRSNTVYSRSVSIPANYPAFPKAQSRTKWSDDPKLHLMSLDSAFASFNLTFDHLDNNSTSHGKRPELSTHRLILELVAWVRSLLFSSAPENSPSYQLENLEKPGLSSHVCLLFVQLLLPFMRRASALMSMMFGVKFPEHHTSNLDDYTEFARLWVFLRLPPPAILLSFQSSSVLTCMVIRWCNQLADFRNKHRSPISVGSGYTMAIPLSAPSIYNLVKLPYRFEVLFEKSYKAYCLRCSSAPTDPALCLLCGRFVCLQAFCCEDNGVGECNLHMRVCGGTTGFYLPVKKCALLMLHLKNGCFLQSPYLDTHGEVDLGLKRGRPLFLSQMRFDDFRIMAAHQKLAITVARKIENVFDIGGWITL
ncbi:E3 ubiquitin-protein ligase ubr1 [Zancudomyces culisetae]|uniref:E3 ubiquitin-protein ligase n=1 Tax=Zancudomyces culisetae TaxID=1213189 RepID=A0A1R1PZ88_ZANCU|nr:E3 ubiquitin-protein ligase ubr1 [Zancudomyces culisetae]|eukprot:OMH86259.1 E3 ubiquitin-protein ligase ubr1 [Zancudomyces culisetae]